MTRLFLNRSEVTSTYPLESWQRVLFAELEAQMTSDTRPFPCVYGVAGFKHDNLRFCFLDEITPETVGPVLEDDLPQTRSNGRNSSIVVFECPAPVQRQSRRSSGFMVTLQPRWVFDGITDTQNMAAKAFGNVRQRLRTFDLLPPSPALGRYGSIALENGTCDAIAMHRAVA